MIYTGDMSIKKQWAVVNKLIEPIDELSNRNWVDGNECAFWHSIGDCRIDRRKLNVKLNTRFNLLGSDERGRNRYYLIDGYVVMFQYDNHNKRYIQVTILCTESEWVELQ